jgi:hypothetical protein
MYSVDRRQIEGWACDPDEEPTASTVVRFFFGGPIDRGAYSIDIVANAANAPSEALDFCGSLDHHFWLNITPKMGNCLDVGNGLVCAYGLDSFGWRSRSSL